MPSCRVFVMMGLIAPLVFTSATTAQSAAQGTAAKEVTAPGAKREMSGVWVYQGSGGAEGTAPEKDMPPMTPWAQAKFNAERPGYGSRAVPDGNDPILQ